MLDLFKKKAKQEAFLALDIGTEVVKAAIFQLEEKRAQSGQLVGRRGIIKGYGRASLKGGEMQSGLMTDLSSVIQSAKAAITMASKQAGLAPTKMIMAIAGESVKGATSVIKHKREDADSKISLTELRNIVHKLQWKAFAEVRKEISRETGYPEIDVKLVSTSIIDLRIDGYKVVNPLGFQGREVEMSIYNCFSPLDRYSGLENIADEIGVESIGIVSEAYALGRALSREDETASAILIDVGGTTTQIAVIQNGAIAGTRMFALGGRTFTKRLAVELNISHQEAEKLKRAYAEDRLEQKSRKIIADIIEGDAEVWLEGVTLTLSEFKNLDVLPSRLLLSGGGTHLTEIKDALNDAKWHKKLHFGRAPQASYLKPSDISQVIDESKQIKGQEDISVMSLVSTAIEIAEEENVTQKTLRKVIGIMKV